MRQLLAALKILADDLAKAPEELVAPMLYTEALSLLRLGSSDDQSGLFAFLSIYIHVGFMVSVFFIFTYVYEKKIKTPFKTFGVQCGFPQDLEKVVRVFQGSVLRMFAAALLPLPDPVKLVSFPKRWRINGRVAIATGQVPHTRPLLAGRIDEAFLDSVEGLDQLLELDFTDGDKVEHVDLRCLLARPEKTAASAPVTASRINAASAASDEPPGKKGAIAQTDFLDNTYARFLELSAHPTRGYTIAVAIKPAQSAWPSVFPMAPSDLFESLVPSVWQPKPRIIPSPHLVQLPRIDPSLLFGCCWALLGVVGCWGLSCFMFTFLFRIKFSIIFIIIFVYRKKKKRWFVCLFLGGLFKNVRGLYGY